MVRRMGGFTVLELMFACAIVAAVTGVGVPAFRDYALNARRTGLVNELVHALHASRSAAIRGGLPVTLCKSSDGRQCTPAASWEQGWIAFVNRDADSPAAVDADESVLLRRAAAERISVRGNRDAVTYWPYSRAGTTASFVFCDARGSSAARAVIVSQTGRPRTSQTDSSGRALECGAVR